MRYRNSSLMLLVMTTLLFTSVSQAMDPPAKMWEKWYYSTWDYAYFKDIELNQNGDFFVTCLVWSYTQPALENYVALLLDGNGNKIWDVPHEYYGEAGYDGIALSDGSYIITGSATEDSTSNSIGLCIHKIASDGSTEWSKIYDYPDTKEAGYGITCLPDGGFAVCGRVHGTGTIGFGQCWILRTDSQGDTLWTRTWGTSPVDTHIHYGKSILYRNDELCVLAKGTDDTLTSNGTHLLFYDLEGNYLRATNYEELNLFSPGDLCPSSDGGFTFVTNTLPVIWHTDQYGATLWWHNIPTDPMAVHEGFCVRRTMDSGYIFSGWTGYWTGPGPNNPNAPVLLVDTGNTQDAWLARYSEEGEYLWGIAEERGVDYHFYSVAQLPEGGYVACGTWFGQGGYLARFAPETGIEVEEPSPVVTLDMFPSPFSSVLSVSFNLPESGKATVLVYDLSGRLVDTVTDELFPAGESTVQWTVPEGVSSGCYLIRYSAGTESDVETVVLLK
jgi:hypothetical protein